MSYADFLIVHPLLGLASIAVPVVLAWVGLSFGLQALVDHFKDSDHGA